MDEGYDGDPLGSLLASLSASYPMPAHAGAPQVTQMSTIMASVITFCGSNAKGLLACYPSSCALQAVGFAPNMRRSNRAHAHHAH